MTIISVDDLLTPLTRADVEGSIYSVAARLGLSTSTWKPGAVVRTMVTATSVVLAALSRVQVDIAKSGFVDLAEVGWLTLLARYVYGVERITETFATGTVQLNNDGGGVYALDPFDLVVANSATGKAYRNTEAVALGAGQVGLDVSVIAAEAGAASSATPGQLSVLTTALPGVTVDNAVGLTGLDNERDSALRARCKERLGALSPMGP